MQNNILGASSHKASFELSIVGQDIEFQVSINGQPVDTNQPPIPPMPGSADSFNFSLPINKYVSADNASRVPQGKILDPDMIGSNIISIGVNKLLSSRAKLHITLIDSNKPNVVIVDRDVDSNNLVEGGGQQFRFSVSSDTELVQQP